MCCARSRWRTTSARRGGPPSWRARRASRPSSASPFATAPACSTAKSLIDEGFIGTPFIFNGYEQNSQWLDPMNPLRQVDIRRRPDRCSRPRRSKATARRSSTSATGGWAPTCTRVVGTMRNFIPERMVRATGQMMRMNIDDGDIYIGEFANGALVLDPDQLRHGRQLSRHRGADLRREGRDHLPAGRGVRRRRDDQARHAGRASSSSRWRCPQRFYPPGGHAARVVALALLRQPDPRLHRRDPGRRRPQRGQLRRRRLGAGDDQRRRAVVPGAPMGDAAARVGPRRRPRRPRSTASSRRSTAAAGDGDLHRACTSTTTGCPTGRRQGLADAGRRVARAARRARCRRPARPTTSALPAFPDDVDLALADAHLEIALAEHDSGHFVHRNPSLWTGEAIFGVAEPGHPRLRAARAERLDARAERARGDSRVPRRMRDRRLPGRRSTGSGRAKRECEAAMRLFGETLPDWVAAQQYPARVGRAGGRRAMPLRAFDELDRWLRRRRPGRTAVMDAFVRWPPRRPSVSRPAATCWRCCSRRGHWRDHADRRSAARGDRRARRSHGARSTTMSRPHGGWPAVQELLAARPCPRRRVPRLPRAEVAGLQGRVRRARPRHLARRAAALRAVPGAHPRRRAASLLPALPLAGAVRPVRHLRLRGRRRSTACRPPRSSSSCVA